MINDKDIFSVGKILKPHGYKGEVGVEIDFDRTLYVDSNIPFFIKIDNIPVPFYVESVSGRNNKTLYIKFEGIDSDKEALTISRHELYTLKSIITEKFGISEEELDFSNEELIGYEIIDNITGNSLGVAEGIGEGKEYDYLILRKQDGDNSISIPLIEEFIYEILENQEGSGVIKVTLPEGFMEI